MGIMNLSLFRKAYMLEFLENDIPKEVFTFSVAPESEDFDFPQRVTETKTFGGSVFDDYGNDTIKINLSGSTVNEEKKLIYKGLTKMPQFLTGEKEIFHLQKILEEWGDIEKTPKKKVYLYDLSKMSLIQMAAIAGGGAPSRNYWRVAIKGLKIKRAKDKPLTYNYTLEMIGFKDPKNVPFPLFGDALEFLDGCQRVLEAIEDVLGYAEFAAAAIDSVASGIVEVKNYFEKIGEMDWTSPEGILKNTAGIIDSGLRVISGNSNNSLFNATQDLISATKKFESLSSSPGTSQSSTTSQNDERTVSFNTGAGSYITPVKVKYSGLLAEPKKPVLAKNAFSGWYNKDYSEEFDFKIEISQNMTLYAKWTQIIATVTFNSRLGTLVPVQDVTIGEVAERPDAPNRNGYVFECWSTDIAGENIFDFSTPITKDITLYAKWRTVYAIKFNSNNGSDVQDQQVEVDGLIVAPLIPEREHYFFMCWCSDHTLNNEYNFNTAVNKDTTLYAKWTQMSNIVTFQSNGGSNVPIQVVEIGQNAVKPGNPEKEGYTFLGWFSDAALINRFSFDTTQIISPITIYASWEVKIYSFSFNTEGGSIVPAQQIEYMKKAVCPINPTKEGFLFKRWVCGDTGVVEYDFNRNVTFNMTIHAEWRRL